MESEEIEWGGKGWAFTKMSDHKHKENRVTVGGSDCR